MLPNGLIPGGLFGNPNLNIYMYGLMIAIGILAVFACLYLYGKLKSVDRKFLDFVYYNGILSIAVGFLAAALFQGVYNYIENPQRGFHLNGGITFLGGLIGGAVTFLAVYVIVRKKLPERLFPNLSLFPCLITVGHAFGRVGCFFAGCCYGRVTDSVFGMKFPDLPDPVFPTMLYEAIFLFLLFGILSFLYLKKDFKYNMSIYLIAYGIFRFAIEFLRDDHRGKFVAGLTPSQFWSILMALIGVALIFCTRYFYQKRGVVATAEVSSESVAEETAESEENETAEETAEPENDETVEPTVEEEEKRESDRAVEGEEGHNG